MFGVTKILDILFGWDLILNWVLHYDCAFNTIFKKIFGGLLFVKFVFILYLRFMFLLRMCDSGSQVVGSWKNVAIKKVHLRNMILEEIINFENWHCWGNFGDR